METNAERELLIEGEDYYFEGGLMVLTARYHLRRGYCCEQRCRHCPYARPNKNSETDDHLQEDQR
jgi:hypothetical protein